MRRKKTPLQTHVRITISDKRRLEAFMRRRGIKSQAAALRKIFNAVRI